MGIMKKKGVLLEAKSEGFDLFFKDNLEPKPWFETTGVRDLWNQAFKQNLAAKAAGNVPIQWHVAQAKAVQAIRKLLGKEFKLISIVHTPMRK